MGLIDEINEQPAVVERLVTALPSRLHAVAAAVRRASIQHVMIAARGTSDHAAVYAVYALGAMAGMPVALAAPSLTSRYERPPRLGRTLVIGISQSGRSPDVVSVLDEARRQGALTLAITNAPDSPLAEAAADVIDLEARPERSVAATKTYTAELAAVAALAVELGDLPVTDRDALRAVPEAMARTLETDEGTIEAVAAEGAAADSCVVIGRGFNLATALEWALKLKELSGIHAQAYSTADFEHGPVASLDDGGTLLAVRARGPLAADLDALLQRLVAERGVRAVVVADEEAVSGTWLSYHDGVPEWLSPLVAILPAQRYAAAATRARGLDAERPRGLNKVTLTR
jgi:glucosamine--fructose-6-phosphate aminotransferase (isomerizing)